MKAKYTKDKVHTITIRINQTELDLLNDSKDAAQLNLSQFVRNTIFN